MRDRIRAKLEKRAADLLIEEMIEMDPTSAMCPRSAEIEQRYLTRIEGWMARLEDPDQCLDIVNRVMKKNKARAKGAGV